MRIFSALLVLFVAFSSLSIAQNKERNKGSMIEYGNPFWDEIKKGIEEFEKKDKPKKKDFKMDYAGLDIPKDVKSFKSQWHNEPVSQAATGTCWSFSGTSFVESEIFRLNKEKIKLSEMYTVYWEYVEKASRFVQEKGNSHFSEGSQGNAVLRMMDKYGAMPLEAYTGMKPEQKYHNHEKMFDEMNTYLQFVMKNSFWNESVVIETIKSILNTYMTTPPESFSYNGKSYTAKDFYQNVVKINPKDYVDILSLMEHGYWKKTIHDVPDNWWRCGNYNNVPLDDFMTTLKNAIKNGYTMFIGGDVSESGYYSFADAAMVPSYDIPSEYIDEYARQFRYSNGTTGDDHGIHIVGWTNHKGADWFLIKDSGSGARNGNNKGYYFYHEDYIKLKMMNFMVHKDAAKDILDKMNK